MLLAMHAHLELLTIVGRFEDASCEGTIFFFFLFIFFFEGLHF